MVHITVDLLRKRAEHNDGELASLQEIGLHQQGLEKIELLGHACRHLRILYLQGNVIGKLENLHRLKELEHLNIALNNITRVQNLQKCESLRKLDLTANFIDKAALPSLCSLQHNQRLQELHLLGNPCAKWKGYRAYVVGALPQLQSLDGKTIPASERIAGRQSLPQVTEDLRKELAEDGIDLEAALRVEDDSLADLDNIPETGHVNDKGELVRPWCPATRVLDQRETERENAAAEAAKRAGMASRGPPDVRQAPPRRDSFPPLEEGEQVRQCNEGKWDFRLLEVDDGAALMLEVDVGAHIDTSLIKADVHPWLVRLLIKGRLLQITLPQEVCPDSSIAQRSCASSRLVVTMPLLGQSAPTGSAVARRALGLASISAKQQLAHGNNKPGASQGRTTPRRVADIVFSELDNDTVPDL